MEHHAGPILLLLKFLSLLNVPFALKEVSIACILSMDLVCKHNVYLDSIIMNASGRPIMLDMLLLASRLAHLTPTLFVPTCLINHSKFAFLLTLESTFFSFLEDADGLLDFAIFTGHGGVAGGSNIIWDPFRHL